jgi:hypothetical protein
MTTNQVPLWVPIAVGLFGLLGALGAQLINARREDRRWRREVEQEELRWQRERTKHLEDRSLEGRIQAYTEMIGLLESWRWTLYPAKRRVLDEHGQLDDAMRTELQQIRALANKSLGPINLHGPNEIRLRMRAAVVSAADFTSELLANAPDEDGLRARWKESTASYYEMRNSMRRDLGVDSADPGN